MPGDATGRQRGSVWDVDGIAIVLLAVVPLQGARDHHGGIGRGNGGRLSPAQYSRRDSAPFAALPVEALHGDDGLLTGKPREKRKQRRSQALVMDDIVVRRHGMRRAQQSVDESFQVFGADGRQAQHAHAVVRVLGWEE